jgi:sec-independent protein translocase protein TatC
MVAPKNNFDEYPDDIFADTRMTFGEHIEELRTRMIRALAGLVLFLCIGFVLDGIGDAVGNKKIGVGRPMLAVITEPVETQVRDFYNRRNTRTGEEKLKDLDKAPPMEEVERIREKLRDHDHNLSSLTPEERHVLLGAPEEMVVTFNVKDFEPAFGPAKEGAPKTITTKVQVNPVQLDYLSKKGETLAESKQYLTTLSAQEAFVVYFKVSIICGIVLCSPWIFYQFWAFVGAGLYPHEKRYVYIFFGPSLALFICGVLLCQFVVLPGAVKALLAFNDFLGFDPDIRLNEWLGLALILPLVFGLSFQTPLIMIFLNRIGIFTAEDYYKKWRHACFIMAFLSALLTPTPDAITMMYMFVPMFGLYLAGAAFCAAYPAPIFTEEEQSAEEVAV